MTPEALAAIAALQELARRIEAKRPEAHKQLDGYMRDGDYAAIAALQEHPMQQLVDIEYELARRAAIAEMKAEG